MANNWFNKCQDYKTKLGLQIQSQTTDSNLLPEVRYNNQQTFDLDENKIFAL
jgi:hypothetical protein